MRTLSIGEQLERFGRRLALGEDSPFARIDRDADHCPVADLYLPGPDAVRVQELNESIDRETR
jgi:hypothetical protein